VKEKEIEPGQKSINSEQGLSPRSSMTSTFLLMNVKHKLCNTGLWSICTL